MRYDFEFRVISNQEPEYDLNSLRFIKWKRDTEIQDLNAISIGVMPLEQDIWSEGKCGFKCLQYMSLGIPSVVSPVGVNEEIIQQGVNGLIATTEEEWGNSLESLIKSIDLRKEIGQAGKQTIKTRYSVLAFEDQYLNLFS